MGLVKKLSWFFHWYKGTKNLWIAQLFYNKNVEKKEAGASSFLMRRTAPARLSGVVISWWSLVARCLPVLHQE